MKRISNFLCQYLPPSLPFLGALGLWWGLTFIGIPRYILPTPVAVVEELLNFDWKWFQQIYVTLQEILGGYLLSITIGILFGIVIAWNDLLKRTFMPAIIFLNGIPKVAAAPIVLVWFGFGKVPNIFMAFLVSFFPILLNTSRGLVEVPNEMIELARTFNIPKWKRFLKIRIPYSLPYIFTGLKLSAIMAVIGAIVGEFVASESGLAALILQAQAYVSTDAMIGALLWISVITMSLYGLVSLVERYLMPWTRYGEEEIT